MWQWTCGHTLIVHMQSSGLKSLTRLYMVAERFWICGWIVVESRGAIHWSCRRNRLQAWDQLVDVLQGEVMNARAAAEQASLIANSLSQTQKHDALARQAEDLWWQIGHLATVQVHALGLRWSRRFKAQASRDREWSVDWISDHECSFASTSSTSFDTAVLHAGIALGRFSAALVGTRRWRWRIAELAQTRAFSRPLRCTKPLQHRCAPLQAARLVQRRQMLISSPTVGWPQREWQSKANTNPTSQLLH